MSDLFEKLGVHEGPFFQDEEIIDPTTTEPNRPGYYSLPHRWAVRPELSAQGDERSGGFLFLPGDVPNSFIDGLIAISGMESTLRRKRDEYAVQALDAPEGKEQELGYLRKLVIADKFALRFALHNLSDSEYDHFPKQPVDIAGLVKAFLKDERQRYGGTHFGVPGLAGKFGGDGHFSQEALSFGYAIEDEYHGVISVWSRAWLVTK